MPSTYVLATEDPDLLRAWWVLVPTGRQVITLDELSLPTVMPAGLPTVVVLDVAASERLPALLRSCPTVAVGEPGSSALERVRASGAAKALLSYEESRTRLGALLPLIEEIAERSAALQLASDRSQRSAPLSRSPFLQRGASPELWEQAHGVVECLGESDHVLAEFRRIIRAQLGTSTVTFFLRTPNGFHADRGDAVCPFDDALCLWWSRSPSVVDGLEWSLEIDAPAEISIRQRLRQWNARMLVPLHDNGWLEGFLALGVRDDGESYRAEDRACAISVGRLLRQCLEQTRRIRTLREQNERWRLAEHYLPNVLVLSEDEPTPKHVPSAVRGLIADVRASREARRLSPGPDQTFRATAGLVAENRGIWVTWEDASAEVRENLERQRSTRLALLHDIALTLNHELGNSLVSLAALRHNPGAETNSPTLLAAIKRDIASLESVNRHLASIPTFSEVVPEEADIRVLLREVSRRTGVALDPTGPSVMLSVVPKLIDFAIEAIIEGLAENRPELGKRELTLRLRSSGDGEQLSANLAIKGPKLALEGIWPLPGPGEVPSNGRISVFVAKEIIRLHGGDIRANQTTLGTEILIVLRNW